MWLCWPMSGRGAGAEVLLFIISKWKRRKKMETLDLMTLVSGPLLGCGLVGLCVVVSLGLGWVIENRHCFIHYFRKLH